MATWATFVVVSDGSGHEAFESRFGAVGLDLDLLAGPEAVVPFIRAKSPVEGRWRDDATCEGGARRPVSEGVARLCLGGADHPDAPSRGRLGAAG
ncbi:hypothetical protein [Streptomyces sp. R41]|uniref:Uncharacterized protein n=1 Tax=Streptomyces sp. R41 TaxID=3238632 RepID=A0AB39RNY6_9ACTN